jgi:hypothetical protein
MTRLNYTQANKVVYELSSALEKEKNLMDHCEIHSIDYRNLVNFVNGNTKEKQPKLIHDFLKSVGYPSKTNRKANYSFIIDTNEAEHLKINELIAL